MATNTITTDQRRAQTSRGLLMLSQAVADNNTILIGQFRDMLKDLGVRVTLPKELAQ